MAENRWKETDKDRVLNAFNHGVLIKEMYCKSCLNSYLILVGIYITCEAAGRYVNYGCPQGNSECRYLFFDQFQHQHAIRSQHTSDHELRGKRIRCFSLNM